MIVAFAGVLALFGSRQGFIVGVLSFAGFALGAFLGTRLGPSAAAARLILPLRAGVRAGRRAAGRARSSPSGLEGVGCRLRRAAVVPGLRLLDGVLGALLSAALGLGIVWIAAAVAAQAPGESQLRADIQRSVILRELNELLPPSGPLLDALARLDPLPSIAGPAPERAPRRTARSPRAPAVAAPRTASCACSAPPAAWRSRAPAGSPSPAS